MRKLIYSALAAIGLLLSPSCSDENEIVNGSGNEALVSFTVNLADGIQTKAISDGKTAKTLFVKVFDKDGKLVPGISENTYTFDGDKNATVNLDLVKGKSYKFLFWAQYTSTETGWSSPYTINDDGSISISYENADSNNEERDAFFATEPLMQVTGSFTKKVYLYRPFAQLNFLTTKKDIEDALQAHIIPENTALKSSVKLSKVATKLYPFENTVGDERTDVAFAASAVPVTFDTNGTVSTSSDQVRIKDRVTVKPSDTGYESATAYYYLATNYFLIGNKENDRKLITATMKIDGADGKLEVNNVPVEWNYRTNIYGDLLTASNKFNVIIAPGYEDVDNNGSDDINSSVPSEVATPKAVAEAITNSSRNIIYTANIAASSSPVVIEIPKVFNDTDDKDLALTFTGTIADDANITIKAAEEGDGLAPKNVTIKTSNGIWTVELTESTVTFTGGSVQAINSSTAPTTLIIAADMVVTQSITADKGGVLVLGQVGTELSAGSNAITATDADATITIQQGASVTGNVEAKNDIVVHGSVNGDLKSDTKIQLSSEATVTGNLEAGTKEIAPGATAPNIDEYTIRTADDLFAFAKQVNEKRNTYSGKTVVLANDIDLAGRAWTPIGGVVSYPSVTFAGTFDGNDKTISNLTASDFTANDAAAGFFGSITGKVKNLTLQNVNIRSSHYAGGIVGYSSTNGAVIENCHVKSGTITSTPERSGSSYDNGDKVGGIIGYMVSGDKVENCSVTDVTIKGYRDLGGIVGCAAGTVSNCTATNVALIQDNTILCERDVDTFDGIVGRKENTLTISDDCSFSIASVKVLGCQRSGNLEQALSLDAKTIEVNLAADVALNTSDFYEKRGGESTETITINGNNHTLTCNSDYRNHITTAGATIVLNNLTMTSNYKTEGSTWDDYAIIFDCPTAISNVTFARQVALSKPYEHTLTRVTINQTDATGDMYALWIEAGADVTIANSTINATNPTEGKLNRAIKISDQYVCLSHDGSTDPSSVAKTKLSVSGTTFKSQKKAAVLVGSCGGADITWGTGNNIGEVNDDTTCPVWVDAAYSSSYEKVTVNNGEVGLKKQEE